MDIDIPSGQTSDGISFPNHNFLNMMGYINTPNQSVITNWNVLKGARLRNIALLACIMY